MAEQTPNPGSAAAIALGCTCPVLDNGHGKGRGDGAFWITDRCPLHSPAVPQRDPDTLEMFDCAGGDAFDGDPARVLGQGTV